jgi:hypothetical protein
VAVLELTAVSVTNAEAVVRRATRPMAHPLATAVIVQRQEQEVIRRKLEQAVIRRRPEQEVIRRKLEQAVDPLTIQGGRTTRLATESKGNAPSF